MRPQPLDLGALLDLVAGEQPQRHADPGLVVGHLHLHVGDIEQGLAFYRDLIGFDVITLMPSAAFVSAGGYHHHLGFNTWRGQGAPPAPANTVGLREWTVVLPEPADVAAVRGRLEAAGAPVEDGGDGSFLTRDPWRNAAAGQDSLSRSSRSRSPNCPRMWPPSSRGHSSGGRSQASSRSFPSGSDR